jgi:hypothetical protein
MTQDTKLEVLTKPKIRGSVKSGTSSPLFSRSTFGSRAQTKFVSYKLERTWTKETCRVRESRTERLLQRKHVW